MVATFLVVLRRPSALADARWGTSGEAWVDDAGEPAGEDGVVGDSAFLQRPRAGEQRGTTLPHAYASHDDEPPSKKELGPWAEVGPASSSSLSESC